MTSDLDRAALEYHRLPKPGKLEITPTKPLGTQRDLALAYSPGVAAACNAIKDDPAQAAELTARGNLIGVISNGLDLMGVSSYYQQIIKGAIIVVAVLIDRSRNMNA